MFDYSNLDGIKNMLNIYSVIAIQDKCYIFAVNLKL